MKLGLKQILLALLTAFAAWLSTMLPALAPVVPGFVAALGTAYGTAAFAVGLGLSLAASLLLSSGGYAPVLTAVMLLAGAVIYIFIKRARPYRHAVVAASIIAALGFYAAICGPSVAAGLDPFASVEDAAKAFASAIEESSVQMGELASFGEYTADYIRLLTAVTPELVTAGICMVSMLSGFFSTVIAHALGVSAKKKGLPALEQRPMAQVHLWRLSKSFTVSAVVMVVFTLAVSIAGLKNASALTAAVECALLFPLALMGFCFCVFLQRASAGKRRGLVLLYVLIAVFLPYSVFALAAMGLVDHIFKRRKKILARMAELERQRRSGDGDKWF